MASVKIARPNMDDEFRRRIETLDKIRSDPRGWEAVNTYMGKAPDVEKTIWFCRNFMSTYDPRAPESGLPAQLPFVPFECQEEYLRHVHAGFENERTTVTVKSRDMGITVCTVAWALVQFLYRPGFRALFVSRKLAMVDAKGSPDAVLGKFRDMMAQLPEELQPAGYDELKHSRIGHIENPENGASVAGEGGPDAGRGGRYSFVALDEFAFQDNAPTVLAAVMQASPAVTILSTPNGTENEFYRMSVSPNVNLLSLPWSRHPWKSQEWYDAEVLKMGDRRIAGQELDCDFLASREESCISPEHVASSVALYELLKDNDYLNSLPITAGADVGAGGRDESGMILRRGPLVVDLDFWNGLDLVETTNRLYMTTQRENIEQTYFDEAGIGLAVTAQLKRFGESRLTGVNVGVSAPKYRVNGLRPSDRFANLRAYLYFDLRDRFRKTHEHYLALQEDPAGQIHSLDELILIPDDAKLREQLVAPRYEINGQGRIIIEAKKQMRARGVPSPDRADSLALSFSPPSPRLSVVPARYL